MTRRHLAVVTIALLTRFAAAGLVPVIPWQEASSHVGELTTVEGVITHAALVGNTCTMTFAPDDPTAFRIVLVIPLISDAGPHVDRRYLNHRIRATGRIDRFAGRPEMLLRSPDQIEVVDTTTTSAPTTTTTSSTTTTQQALGAPITPVAAAVPSSTPPVPPPAPAPPIEPTPPALDAGPFQALAAGPTPACIDARATWRAHASEADEGASTLRRCLAASPYRCGDVAARLGPLLERLATHERLVRETCD